jgi:hypothetical protein
MAVDSLFDKASGFVAGLRAGQVDALPEAYRRQAFSCVGCSNKFVVGDMEMVHPDNGFGLCRNCFKFVWLATKEKIARLGKGAARRTAQAPAAAPPRAPGKPPWEVLGIAQDATVDQIKKAYRRLAMEWHPDRVPASASTAEKQRSQAMFQEVTRAKDVMMKVRSAPEG